MVRHMFPGGNTPTGFFSYFNNILPFNDAKKTIYIKGGSGTGKSTFMKKVGKIFEEKDFDVEYMHCSNDYQSMDGILIPKLKVSIVDATAPHIQDPTAPIVIDEILNLAEFLNRRELEKYSDELKKLLSDKKVFFEKAYRYLSAAYNIYLNNTSIYNKTLDYGKLNHATYELIHELYEGIDISNKIGWNRKLFLSAITPDGLKNFINETLRKNKVYILYGSNGCGTDIMLSNIQKEANIRNLYTESFYCPLNPEKLEHLIIPYLDICFTTHNYYHNSDWESSNKIYFKDFYDESYVLDREEEVAYNTKKFEELLHKSMKTMKSSKKLHDRIEEIYVSNMDFKQLDEAYQDTISYLLNLIK